ncbi:MAG: type II secretion system F family protein [Mycobacteriales bacterium]
MRSVAAACLALAATTLLLRRDRLRQAPDPRSASSPWHGRRLAALARIARLERRRKRFQRGSATTDLPLALDLMASVLRAGEPPSTAAAAVAGVIGSPVGEALLAVSRAAELGASPDVAWQHLGLLTGLQSVSRTAARTAESGTRLADELSQIAVDQRARLAAAAQERVRRAGVLVVLPLGLCFLPAFIVLGVIPIVIGMAGAVLR